MNIIDLHSLKLTARPLKKWWFPIGISFSRGLFSGAFTVSFREGHQPLSSKIKKRYQGGFLLASCRQVVRDFVTALSMPRGIDEEFMKLSFQAPNLMIFQWFDVL